MQSLRAVLQHNSETLNDLALSAEQRLQDGQILFDKESFSGAIYVAGYSAEMLLKYAYFRITGASAGDVVSARLESARKRGQNMIPEVDHENFHSLRFWIRLI